MVTSWALKGQRCNVPTLGDHHRVETYDDQSSQMEFIESTGVFERHCGVQFALIFIFSLFNFSGEHSLHSSDVELQPMDIADDIKTHVEVCLVY